MIEVVTSQMVVYGVLGLLQVIIMAITTIYAFDVRKSFIDFLLDHACCEKHNVECN